MLDYYQKEKIMDVLLENYKNSKPVYQSLFKAVPISKYNELKPFIDYTKYYIIFRGPRKRCAYSTLKADAKAFDVYRFSDRDTRENRIEREAFNRGRKYERFGGKYGLHR